MALFLLKDKKTADGDSRALGERPYGVWRLRGGDGNQGAPLRRICNAISLTEYTANMQHDFIDRIYGEFAT